MPTLTSTLAAFHFLMFNVIVLHADMLPRLPNIFCNRMRDQCFVISQKADGVKALV